MSPTLAAKTKTRLEWGTQRVGCVRLKNKGTTGARGGERFVPQLFFANANRAAGGLGRWSWVRAAE